ncbi:hypothetical protein IG631_24156 [Alternaria alternata]|nr:hypothetical protein IG631_24156 [Alternaria alternata]
MGEVGGRALRCHNVSVRSQADAEEHATRPGHAHGTAIRVQVIRKLSTHEVKEA